MGLKKKKNVIVLTLCMVVSFILYQLYFFVTINSETSYNNKIISVLDVKMKQTKVNHLRSSIDRYITDNGVLKGIQYSSMIHYRPDTNKQFKCLHSEQWVPFEFVNDDFCDCVDSTDEPSTSACPNGTFYCDTQYPGKNVRLNKIPSNKVNDGICDCCDGSDEWLREDNLKILSQSFDKGYRQYVDKCSSNCYT